MRRTKKLYWEKLLLMLSGCAFLFQIMPAWIQGFLGTVVSAVVLCLTVWKLPLSGERIRGLLENGKILGVSLVLELGFGCNFYNNWIASRNVERIAGLIRLEAATFLGMTTAAVCLLSLPVLAAALGYFTQTVQREYRQTAAITETKGIPFGKAVGILFLIYLIGISGLIRADYLYRDDLGRALYGYKQWDYFSRYLSTALATLVHGGDYLVDAAPMPQMLAMLLMAVAGVTLLYVVYDRTRFTGWELAVLIPLGLNPYFLECVSYRFDAPYMAISVLAAVLPLLMRRGRPVAYVFASMLGILAVCTSYQAATGIFPMLVILLMLRMWNQGKPLREIFRFCGLSAAGYVLGMLFFLVVLMRPADAGYVSNTMPEATGLVQTLLYNYKQYWKYFRKDFQPLWKVLTALAAAVFLWASVLGARRNKAASAGIAVVCVAMMALLSFGIYPALAEPVFAPRAMYGIGVVLSIFGIVAAEQSEKILRKLPILLLSWAFVVFAFTYGNALVSQKEYTDFRVRMVIDDLRDMEVFLGEEPVTVQIAGSIKKAPILRNNKREEYHMLNRLLPKTFGNTGEWERYNFYYYYDLRNVVWDRSVNLREMDLPVIEDTMYHTIRGKDTYILVELK